MSLAERLKSSRKAAGKTQTDVSKAVGLTQPSYQALESGKALKSAFLPLIANYLGVDPFWLTTGASSDSFQENEMLGAIEVNESDDSNGLIWIDVVEARFSCGTGEDIEFHFDVVNGKIPFAPSFFKRKNVSPENMRIIISKGDSMEDYIFDEDLVGIDISKRDVCDGDIYAVYFAGEGVLKQIFKEADGSLILHSLNSKYRDKVVTEVNGHNFKVMGKQFWRSG